MRLYLIRHAESENNSKPAYQRVEDPSITSRGRLQSECLADWMKTFSYDFLITSPFRRTLQTTRAVIDKKPQVLRIWHNVYERGGCYRGHLPGTLTGAPGMGRSEILQHASSDPTTCLLDDTITEEGWWNERTPENDQQVEQRASEVADRFIHEFGSTDLSIVSVIHADFIRSLLQVMLHGIVDAQRLGPFLNTGITRITHQNNKWHLDWLNSVSHLPERLMTGTEHSGMSQSSK